MWLSTSRPLFGHCVLQTTERLQTDVYMRVCVYVYICVCSFIVVRIRSVKGPVKQRSSSDRFSCEWPELFSLIKIM